MEKPLKARIADNLRMELKYSGMKQVEIAREVGVSPNTISRIAHGKMLPPLEILSKLCNVIGCSADDILEVK